MNLQTEQSRLLFIQCIKGPNRINRLSKGSFFLTDHGGSWLVVMINID